MASSSTSSTVAKQPLMRGSPTSDYSVLDGRAEVLHKTGSQVECGDLVSKAMCGICFPTETLIFRYGKYESTLTTPGLYWNNFCGREQRVCSTAIQSLDLPAYNGKNLVVLDSRGNPLVVSGVVVYHIDDTYKATVATENYRTFIETQSEAVLKSVIGRFPYEAQGDAACLQRNGDVVAQALKVELQRQLVVAGVHIRSFSLKEISYAPVIAAAMLKRQQAQAMVEARQTIVAGAVDMTHSAVEQLKERGLKLDDKETGRLVSNLLTVICSESDATPTLPLA
eukprot:gene1216-34751_t